jgi:hypothetical protein
MAISEYRNTMDTKAENRERFDIVVSSRFRKSACAFIAKGENAKKETIDMPAGNHSQPRAVINFITGIRGWSNKKGKTIPVRDFHNSYPNFW